MHFDLTELIKSAGYIGIFLIIFAESGLLVGMFFPGDSLLFTAGFLASQDILSLPILLVITFTAAILGDSVGYATGKRYGHRIFKKKDSIFFSQQHITRSEKFFEKHGGKTIILARFTPVVRTIAPILAGVGKMTYRRFLFFNVIGAFIWAIGLTVLGYVLGKSVPDVDRYLLPAVFVVAAISILPTAIHILKDADQRANIIRIIKRTPKP